MRFNQLVIAGSVVAAAFVIASPAAAVDWAAVTTIFGRDPVVQAGDIHRFNFPRSDLSVTLDGVAIQPGFALGSWLAFHPMGEEAMVMGDLVLKQDEIAAVTSRLAAGGIDITAIHHHVLRAEPLPMYMHVEGHGDAARMAETLRAALEATATPLEPPAAAAAAKELGFDTAAVDAAMGHKGEAAGGLFRYSIPRAEEITAAGAAVPTALGLGIAINFQPTGAGKAAITGDFVLTADEVNPVIAALRDSGIEVTALHNHMLNEEPRLFFMHFWANDDAEKLAKGLGAALNRVNTKK